MQHMAWTTTSVHHCCESKLLANHVRFLGIVCFRYFVRLQNVFSTAAQAACCYTVNNSDCHCLTLLASAFANI